MKIENYLKQYQPVCYRVFSNSLQEGRLNHAYLLAGEKGVPLKEIAIFLAKSIVCDHPSPLADETCTSCLRIEDGSYTDLIVLDGEEDSIKKDEIVELTESFSKTSVEAKGVMIYIINLAENMNPNATNSLLKFLEEPVPGTYAILTTNNSSKILPTIISRCEVIRLDAMPHEEILKGCKELGLDEKKSELLSFFYGAPELIQDKLNDEDAEDIPGLLEVVCDALNNNPSKTRFLFQSRIDPAWNSKIKAGILIDLLIVIYRELLSLSYGFNTGLPSYIDLLKPLVTNSVKLSEQLDSLLKAKSELETNINPTLLLDHIIITLTKEDTL